MQTDTSDITSSRPVDGDIADEHEVEGGHPHLPPLSIWPIATAAGVTLAASGLVTDWEVGVVGVIVMFTAIIMWIQELRRERVESH